MNVIRNVKDSSLKQLLREPELFADFLRDFLPIGLLGDVKPEDIDDISERFIPLFQEEKNSDTVKRINIRGKAPLFVIAIAEYESNVNHRASFKMLQYITLVLAEHERDVNKYKKHTSSMKKFKFPPVLPIVFYDGANKWTAAKNFIDKTEMSEVFEKYIPKFEYELVDLTQYNVEDLIRFGNALSLFMIVDKVRTTEEINLLKNLPDDYFDRVKQNLPPGLYTLLANVIELFLKRINAPDEDVETVLEKINERRLSEMFNFVGDYDVQETRRVAKAEGEARGITIGEVNRAMAMARRMLDRNEPIEQIIEYTGLSREEVEGLLQDCD